MRQCKWVLVCDDIAGRTWQVLSGTCGASSGDVHAGMRQHSVRGQAAVRVAGSSSGQPRAPLVRCALGQKY